METSTLETGEHKRSHSPELHNPTNSQVMNGAEEEADVTAEELERANYATLCHILVTVAPSALRNVFNGVHPPLHLAANLQKPQTQVTLRRLRQHGVVDDKQWKLVFPARRAAVTSERFDAVLLNTLLKHVCSVSAPYPNGWQGVPIHGDTSIPADMTRITWFRALLASREQNPRVSGKEFQAYYQQLSGLLDRLGGVNAKLRVERAAREKVDREDARQYVRQLAEWDEAASVAGRLEDKLQNLTRKRESGQHDLANLIDHSHLQMGEESDGASHSTRQDSGRASGYTDSRSISTVTRASTTASSYRRSSPSRRKPRSSTTGSQANEKPADMAAHERNILLQFYKPLTETVKSEDVVGKLVQRGVLSHEEKNRISLAPRNLERMKLVIELIPKKGGNAFEKFLDVIKYKYTSLYDQLTKAKQAPFIEEKPDEMTQCGNALRTQYVAQYAKISPIPWNKGATSTFEEFYERPYITDHNGKCFDPDQIFDGHRKCENPRKILLEGDSGVGKTFLCQRLAYKWSQGENLFTRKKFRLVFYIELRRVTGSIPEAIIEQCLPQSYPGSADDVHALLSAHHPDCLLVLDGYDELSAEASDVWEVMDRKLYPKCGLILATNTEMFNIHNRKYFDTKLILHGLSPDTQEDLIRKYADISGNSVESYAGLLAKIINEFDTTVRVLSLNPLYCLCMSLINETFISLDFNTLSFMLQNFVNAIQKFYCKQKKITLSEEIIPDEVKILTTAVSKAAYKTMVANQTVFAQEKLDRLAEYQTTDALFQLGLMEIYVHHPADGNAKVKQHVYFTNKVLHQFLAAKHLASMETEDCIAMKESLTTEPHLSRVAAFYCGIHRFDYNLRSMREIFELISVHNRDKWKIRQVKQERSLVSNGALNQKAEGRVEDFRLGLECLCECEGRKDVMDFITESLPRRLYAKHKDRQSIQMIGGLAHVIKANKPCVTELELRLDHVGAYQEYSMLLLADALEKSTQVHTLKLRWTRDDLLALFIANIFGKNESIKTLKLSDESAAPTAGGADAISATVWSHLRSAGNSLVHVRNLALNHCKSPAFNSSLIRNLRGDYETLSLTGSHVDLVGAQDLAARIEKSKVMQVLNLNCVRMSSADFLNVTYGLRLNRSINELSMADIQLDNAKMEAFADSLKFNGTIKRVDLSHNTLTDDQCRMLAQALSVNSRLLALQLTSCKLSEDGARQLRRQKRESLVISGLGDKGLLTRYTFGRGGDKTSADEADDTPASPVHRK